MKNLFKFVVFVVLLSVGISALYDYQLRHGHLNFLARVTPEKYTLASKTSLDPKAIPTLAALDRERRALVSSVIPAVVSVRTSRKIAIRRQYALDPYEFFNLNPRQFRNPNDEALVQNSLGSGVIVTNEGHIITNNHVVDQVDEIEVQFSDGQTKKARLVGADEKSDLAVLKVDDSQVKPLPLGDSDSVQAGDFVLAIGNPFGFEETVTDGIISSKGRPNRVDGFGDFLQTNAAINPGNSGGPLINLKGEVIGINTAIISRSGGSQGIGFAIPSNTVRTALENLLQHGRIIRGYLGIQTRYEQQPGQNAAPSEGVVVDDVVPGSPAADAKLQKNDVILKFDGHEVKNFPELRTLVSQAELNKQVEIDIKRDGKPLKVTTAIREQPQDYPTTRVNPRPNQPSGPAAPGGQLDENNPLGSMEVQELTPEIARRLDIPNAVHGVVITKIDPSDNSGLQTGDVIEEINQQPVRTVDEFKKAMNALDPNQSHVLSVCRHRTRSFLVIRP